MGVVGLIHIFRHMQKAICVVTRKIGRCRTLTKWAVYAKALYLLYDVNTKS